MALMTELRRRNVFKVALLYAVASWLVVWFVEALMARFTLPVWTETFALVMLAIGFPVALWFAWTYEITPVGLKKADEVDQTQSIVYKTGQKLNAAVAVLLVLGVLAVFGQQLLPKYEFLVPGGPEGDLPMSESTPAEIRSFDLDNGLKLIVWPDPDAVDVVVYDVIHSVGADGICTPGHVTAYTARLPVDALDAVLELEAARVQNQLPDAAPIELEYGVKYGEHRVYADTRHLIPMFAELVGAAPCPDEALISFYRNFFAPNDATLIVVGDVAPDDVFKIALDRFEHIPARLLPPVERRPQQDMRGIRRIVFDPAVQLPVMRLSFHADAGMDYQPLPMALLLYVLVGNEQSRLQQALVAEEDAAATGVSGHMDAAFGPAVTHFDLMLPADGDIGAAEQALLAALQQVVDEGVTEDEVAAARAAILMDYEESLKTTAGKAGALGLYQVFADDYEALFTIPAELHSIGPDDLQGVAAGLFRESNLSVDIVQPKPVE